MKKTCKICGANSEKEYCFQHKPRKPLKKSKYIMGIDPYDENSEPSKSAISWVDRMKPLQHQNNIQMEMYNMFYRIWKKRPHKCENCNDSLGNEPLSYMFDHILEKSKYPELTLEEENIMLLCLECHDNKTRGNLSDKMKEREQYVREKFDIL